MRRGSLPAMAMLSRLKAAARALLGGDASQSAFGLLSGATRGFAPRKGTRELLIAYKTMPWFRAVTHRIASDVAATPLRLYAAKAAKRKSELASSVAIIRRAAGRPEDASAQVRFAKAMMQDARAAGDLQEVASHPFLDLMRTMNPALRGADAHFVTQLYQELKGEAFWVKERNGLGQPLELWPVPPHWVVETPYPAKPSYRMSYAGWNRTIDERDVHWMRSPDPEHPYARGVGMGEALADELDVDEFIVQRIKGFFVSGAVPPLFVSQEGVGPDELDRLKERWLQQHQGNAKAHLPHFTNGKLQVEQLGYNFQELQLNDLRKHQADMIRQVYGVPPEILGVIENSNRATIDASYLLYSLGVLCPRLEFRCNSLEPLLAEWDERLILDYVSPVPEDREFKKSLMVALPSNYRVNEHRALAGEPPIEGEEGEAFYAPPAPTVTFGPPSQQLAGDPPWTKSLRPRRKDRTVPEMENVLEALRPERLTQETDPLWQKRVEEWGAAALQELGIDPTHFDMRNPLVRDILDDAGRRITGVTETTRERLMGTLTEGVYAGEGIEELSRRVRDTFDEASSSRARTIARTEVVGSSNRANVAAWELSGVVEQKEWLAVRDGNTRPEHADMDGQTVGLRATFRSPDGYTAQHPGGFGRPELDINCRCTALPRVSDPKAAPGAVRKTMSEEEKAARWKRFDSELLPWENAAEDALRRGFRAQEKDVLEALQKLA